MMNLDKLTRELANNIDLQKENLIFERIKERVGIDVNRENMNKYAEHLTSKEYKNELDITTYYFYDKILLITFVQNRFPDFNLGDKLEFKTGLCYI